MTKSVIPASYNGSKGLSETEFFNGSKSFGSIRKTQEIQKEDLIVKRNSIKIVYNPTENTFSYYFSNDFGEWKPVSGSSPLSRQYYKLADLGDNNRGKNIVEKIDQVYNRKNKGLDIIFEGPVDLYECLVSNIERYLKGHDIRYKSKTTKIAVVGKIGVGKTCLINGIAEMDGSILENCMTGIKYTKFRDKAHCIDWIKVKGIDLGSQQVTFETLRELVVSGVSKILYCISGESGRIEDIERKMIIQLKEQFPAVDVITVITKCYKEDYQDIKDTIEQIIGNGKVFPILAKEYKVKRGIVSAFGLKELATYIFEGKEFFQKTSTSFTENYQKIMVVGKIASGKTTLIEACGQYKQRRLKVSDQGKYRVYADDVNQIQWYEVKGIDLGIENVENALSTVKSLIEEGCKYLLYCVPGDTGKLEKTEIELIQKIKDSFPQVRVLIVLTKLYREMISDIQSGMETLVGKRNVIETLAKAYATRIKNPQTGEVLIKEPYGIKEIYDAIGG